jgi:hypothetical protein
VLLGARLPAKHSWRKEMLEVAALPSGVGRLHNAALLLGAPVGFVRFNVFVRLPVSHLPILS